MPTFPNIDIIENSNWFSSSDLLNLSFEMYSTVRITRGGSSLSDVNPPLLPLALLEDNYLADPPN